LQNNPLIRALEYRDRLSDEERAILNAGLSRIRTVAAGHDLVEEGDIPTESSLQLSGFSVRYHLMSDGSRQISAFHIAGDFVDLHSLLLGRMDHSVGAITEVTVAAVPHTYLREITAAHPHLSRLLWLSTLIDAAMHRRWLVAAGRLDAVGRVAHFLCEVFVRMRMVGLTNGFAFRLPISQSVLSDAMGLSLVHINRTIQKLRAQQLIRWHLDAVEILDWEGLQAVSEFNPDYLNIESMPR
jgi:CRP-like cAMP-binding protein